MDQVSGIAPGVAAFGGLESLATGGGTAGKRLLDSGFDINVLRACSAAPGETPNPLSVNAVLRRDEWKQFDTVVQATARERLNVTQYLIGKGLVYNLPNAMGTMTLEWESWVGDLVDAELTMSGQNEATKDRMGFTTVNMPIPIIHKEFFYNLRHLEAARRNGRNVETAHAQEATRKVSELVENLIFTGATIAGGTIYGLLNHPLRKTVAKSLTWSAAASDTDRANIVGDVRAMVDLAALPPNNMEGPYVLFIPRALQSSLEEDYKANGDDTVLDRIRKVAGIADVVFTNRLTGNNVVLLQLTTDVFEMINGLAPTMVEWDSHGGFQHNFKIFGIMIPRVRANGDGQSGVVHLS